MFNGVDTILKTDDRTEIELVLHSTGDDGWLIKFLVTTARSHP